MGKTRQAASPDSLFEGVLPNKTKIRRIIRSIVIAAIVVVTFMIVNNIFDFIPIKAF